MLTFLTLLVAVLMVTVPGHSLDFLLYTEILKALRVNHTLPHKKVKQENAPGGKIMQGEGRKALRYIDRLMHFEAGKRAEKASKSLWSRKLEGGMPGAEKFLIDMKELGS